MPCPSQPTRLDHSNYARRRVQVMKLLIMRFAPTSCQFLPLQHKYSPPFVIFRNKLIFTVSCLSYTQRPSWRTTPCRLSTTAYSIYLQLPFISGGRNLRTRHAVVTTRPTEHASRWNRTVISDRLFSFVNKRTQF
jgi:hypothetical protein